MDGFYSYVKVIIGFNLRIILLMPSDVEKGYKMDADCWFNYETKREILCGHGC